MDRLLGAARGRLEPLARVLAAPFLALRIPPTAITLLSLPLAGASAYFASQRSWGLALGVGLAAALFDFIDGAVARLGNRVTPFGGFLDSTLDRVVDLLFLFGLGLGLGTPAGWIWVGLAIVGSYGTSYARARAYEAMAVPREAWHDWFERPERVLLLGLAVLAQVLLDAAAFTFDAVFWGVVAVAVGANLTFARRVLRVRRMLAAGPSRG